MFVCCECCVLSSRGLCDGLITRPEESYRLWRVVCDEETSKMRRLKPATGLWKIQPHWVVTPRKQTSNKQKILQFFPLPRNCVSLKVSLNLLQFVVKYHAMKAHGWVEVYLEDLVILELDGGEWSFSRPGLTAPL
jgi:hypothetical protein